MRQPNRQMGLTAPDDDMYTQQALDQVLSGRRAQPRVGNPAARQMPDEPTASRVTPGAERGSGLSDMMGGNAGITGGMPKTKPTLYDNTPGSDIGPTTTFGDGSVMATTNKQNEDTLARQPANTQRWTGSITDAAGPVSGDKKLYGLEGFDQGKLDSGHDSPKYRVGRALQGFDPAQGLTPEVIAALNALGIGTFSGERDKLSVTSDDPRWNGVTKFDVGRDFSKGDGSTGSDAWSFQNDMPGQNAPAGGEQPIGNDMFAGQMPGAMSQSAVDPFAGQSTYQSLLARLREVLGGENPEQAALSQVLGK
jgi:hypothetical protein